MENGHVTKAGKRADVNVSANVTIMPSTTAEAVVLGILLLEIDFFKKKLNFIFLEKISKRRIKFHLLLYL